MTITSKELAKEISEDAVLSPRKAEEFLSLVFEIFAETLARGDEIKIPGFGVFMVREKAARKGRNPQTGERMEIAARRVVKFKPGAILRKTLERI
jgi:integration host factor subunit alpha